LEHFPERLPGRLAEQAEIAAVVFENGAQELGDGEDVLGVADLLQDVRIEPLGEKQDALLLARGTEESDMLSTAYQYMWNANRIWLTLFVPVVE
jgi:hypothetical protein